MTMILLDLLKVLKGDISVYSAEGKLLIRSENNKISIAELIDWGNAYVLPSISGRHFFAFSTLSIYE